MTFHWDESMYDMESIAQVSRVLSQHMLDSWIRLPESDKEQRQTMEAYCLGFRGAVGSTDVTLIRWDKCSVIDARSYKGKESFQPLPYEVTIHHSMLVLGQVAALRVQERMRE
ncbi:unnamed protein product [Choristocarpus tenellus]